MSWKDHFYEAVAEWARGRGLDVTEVTGVTQDLPSEWYCETCGPDPITVDITYTDTNGMAGFTMYYGDLGEFINAL